MGIFVFTISILTFLLNFRPHTPQLEKYLFHPNLDYNISSLNVKFLGNTNILITDGKTSILTDGFFS